MVRKCRKNALKMHCKYYKKYTENSLKIHCECYSAPTHVADTVHSYTRTQRTRETIKFNKATADIYERNWIYALLH